MPNPNPLKLFVAYSHKDEAKIDDFLKHLAMLKENKLIDTWYDRKILGGEDYQKAIDNNFYDSDIICLLLSANFLASKACMDEKNRALKQSQSKNARVVPIIVTTCAWQDDAGLSKLLALPIDGKPISKYRNAADAWHEVYEGLKKIVLMEKKIQNIELSDNISIFLNDAELLSNAHSQKDKVLLDDIFIHPDVVEYDAIYNIRTKTNTKKIIDSLVSPIQVILAGENQSGKTTLCKKIFTELRKRKFIPVYLYDKSATYAGKMDTRIHNGFNEQYTNIDIKDVESFRVIPIIDDFHFAKNKEKLLIELKKYENVILVIDDIYSLNFKDEKLLTGFNHYKIAEFDPIRRDRLIQKWINISEEYFLPGIQSNHNYQILDNKTELVNETLGKVFGQGIMPSYPFFILSIISTYDTIARPLDQEITSQGYCYQALVYLYLRKHGVKNDDIDTYVNFLTEFAFYCYSNSQYEISKIEFGRFMESYAEKFNLFIDQDILIRTLHSSHIVVLDSFNNYSFHYLYLYYFFVAKYLADHIESNLEIISKLVNNLHVDENAYIAIFVSHHSNNDTILDEVMLNALMIFDEYEPATLSDKDLSFFSGQLRNIVEAVLPSPDMSPEQERQKRLEHQSVIEENNGATIEENEDGDKLVLELRRSVKTVEVIGRIIKNRAGSLNRKKLESLFEEAMELHLRSLTSFLNIIRSKEQQDNIIQFISDSLKRIIEDKSIERRTEGKKDVSLDVKTREKISKRIFWNVNFFAIWGLINLIIKSLGSNKLLSIAESVCDKKNTPASFLIKHGILMWYGKNLQVKEIIDKFERDGFSDIAKRIMRFMIVNHCSMHEIGHANIQKLVEGLNMNRQKLLECKYRKEDRNTN